MRGAGRARDGHDLPMEHLPDLLHFPGGCGALKDGMPSSFRLALFVPSSPFRGSSFSEASVKD